MRLISIITIVRNDRAGLERTYRSLADQSFQDYEWHIVDGASTDGTAEFANSLQHHGACVSSFPDKGIFDAMNTGLARAEGDYVVFMNAGDEFASKNTLSLVADHLKKLQPDLLYGNSLERYAGSRLIEKVARGHQHLAYGMFACHQACYYRRSLMRDFRYDTSFKIAGDYEFTARFMLQASRVHHIPEPLAIFDLSGASSVQRARGRQENWKIQRDVLHLPLIKRISNRVTYWASSFLTERLPWLYKLLRYRQHAAV